MREVQSCSVSLWNIAVTRKTGGTISNSLNAKLRHVASTLSFVASAGTSEEFILKRQIMMGIKSGRAWLDCSNPTMAENSLELALQCLERHQNQVIDAVNQGKLPNPDKSKLELEKDFFRIYAFKAECGVALSKHDEAFQFIQRAKEILKRLPKEGTFLCFLCYNFGVDTFHMQKYEESITWLRESFELGKGVQSVGPKNQAKTLRVLANCYLELDGKQHWQKALNAVGLANAEHSHPAGLHLKVKILLLGDSPDTRLQSAFDDVLRHPDLSIDMALETIKLVTQYNNEYCESDQIDKAKEFIEECINTDYCESDQINKARRFIEECINSEYCESDLIDKARFIEEYIDSEYCESDQIDTAKEFIEECINKHLSGQPLQHDALKRFQFIIWERASQAYESNNFDEALIWFNYSLSLFNKNDESSWKNLSKLQRNITSCHIGLQQFDKAADTVKEAQQYDSLSPHTHYLIYKIALSQCDNTKAVDALQKMCALANNKDDAEKQENKQDDIHVLICLAAQLAFEKSNREVAVTALEGLVENADNIQQVLTSLRCLIRLKLTINSADDQKRSENTDILKYVETAYSKLTEMKGKQESCESVQKEAAWFMKIAWNLGIQNENSSYNMHQFFYHCCKFGRLCAVDMGNLIRQKTCMLMAAASCLQMAKDISNEQEKKTALHQVLSHVKECREIRQQIKDNKISDTDTQKDTTVVLLVLYEFEAYARLGQTDELSKILDKALSLPFAEPKTFETMAALSMESPSNCKVVSIRALKVSVKKYMQAENPDYIKCSKVFRSLIQLSLKDNSSTDIDSKEETWQYYMEVVQIIENKAKGDYPEIETVWLMTKAWNCGIYLYSASHYQEAERWCSLAINLLKHLSDLKSNYEPQMTIVYAEILSKLDSTSFPTGVEE
ncbi:testis-expressed protein 11-like [Saccoglossus kowalevskii]